MTRPSPLGALGIALSWLAALFLAVIRPDWLPEALHAIGPWLAGALLLASLALSARLEPAYATLNSGLLAVARTVSIIALAIMVILILAQIFFRYVVGDALNWTEEAARFGMLWMTGLMAPLAYRMGGFVAIDMAERALGTRLSAILTLMLLVLSLVVLIYMVWLGWKNHVDTLSGRGKSSSLRVPLSLFGGQNIKFSNQWAFASLWVGACALILVNIELMQRQIITLTGGGDRLAPLQADEEIAGAS